MTDEKTTPGWSRTNDLRIRNPLLYPAELRALVRDTCWRLTRLISSSSIAAQSIEPLLTFCKLCGQGRGR